RDVSAGNRSFPVGHHPPSAGLSGFKALHRLARRRSKEAEFQEGWPRPTPAKGLAPLRHRSSSEVTLSECDPEEPAESGGVGGGAGLFREYGSTSSIDVQGISEQSFFDMLNEFRARKPEPGAGAAEGAAFPTAGKAEPRTTPDAGAESIFRKLRSGRAEGESGKDPEEARPEGTKSWICQKSFAHYDVQSMLFDLNAVALNRASVSHRRNTTTGASAASAGAVRGGSGSSGPWEASSFLKEELNWKENLEHDGGDSTSNELLLSCPHFRNEIGGSGERDLSFSRGTPTAATAGGFPEPPGAAVRPTNAGVSVLEVAKERRRDPERLRHHSVEHVDLGARYYREHFHGR
ncbi:SI1L3 protein, partial [Baryphthengus martii]|nr:SI1L3 protein [Baryphthengus martii]